MSNKAFEDLTEAELAELETREWTSEQITTAITMALREGAMEAVVDLLHRLARVDPKAARFLLDGIELTELRRKP